MADVSLITKQLLEAQQSGKLGSLVGHEEAAKVGSGALPTDYEGLVKAFGQSDIDALGGGGAAAAPGASAAPTAAPTAGGGAAAAPAAAALGPPAIPPPPPPALNTSAGWASQNAPGSLAGNLGGRRPAGPFGELQEVMSRRGRMY